MNHPVSVTNLIDPALAIVAVGDPGRTRAVLASILFLVAIGIGLVALAVWLIRSTRVDPEVLAPLEVMSERTWRRADPVWQRRRLDEVRPEGAEPLDPTVPPPSPDAEFDRGPQSIGFDDFDDLLRRFGVDLTETASDTPAPADQASAAEPPLDEHEIPTSPPVAIEPTEPTAPTGDDGDTDLGPVATGRGAEVAAAADADVSDDEADDAERVDDAERSGDDADADVSGGVSDGEGTDHGAGQPDEHERVDAHDRG